MTSSGHVRVTIGNLTGVSSTWQKGVTMNIGGKTVKVDFPLKRFMIGMAIISAFMLTAYYQILYTDMVEIAKRDGYEFDTMRVWTQFFRTIAINVAVQSAGLAVVGYLVWQMLKYNNEALDSRNASLKKYGYRRMQEESGEDRIRAREEILEEGLEEEFGDVFTDGPRQEGGPQQEWSTPAKSVPSDGPRH